MDRKTFYKITLQTVLPLMLQSLLTSCVNFIDQIMVGKLGVAEIAAVGVANKLYSLFYLVLYGTCCACVMFVSQYWGKKDVNGIRKTMGMTCSITISLGIAVTIATALFPRQCMQLFTSDEAVIVSGTAYLRAISASYLLLSLIYPINYLLRGMTRVKIVLVSASVSVIMNVLANYAFIFGNMGMPELGVAGAAVGTVVTRGSELTILLIYLIATKNEVISNIPEMFHYSRDGFLTFLKKALPLAGNEFFWGVGTTLYFTIYGRIGTEQLAAMSIMSTIQTMEQTFSLSLSSSASVIVGNQIGRGDREEVFRCGARFHRLAVFVGVFVAALIFLFIHPIVGLYGITGTEAGIYLTQCLTILCCYLPVNCYNSMNIEGLFRSGGDIRTVLIMDMGGIWMIGLPVTFLFGEVLKMPIAVVYSAFVAVELYKLPIGIHRYRSGKWLHRLDLK